MRPSSRVHTYQLATNSKSMNNTTTITNPILPAAGVRRRPAKVHRAHPTGFYDVASLNSTGRGEIESCRDSEAKLLHYRQNLKIATFNIQTLFVKEVDKILQKNRRDDIEYA